MSKFVSLCVKHTVQLFLFRAKPKGWLIVLAHNHTHTHTHTNKTAKPGTKRIPYPLLESTNWLKDDIHNNYMAPNIRTQRLWIRRYKKGFPTYPKKASTSSQREKWQIARIVRMPPTHFSTRFTKDVAKSASLHSQRQMWKICSELVCPQNICRMNM